MPIKSKTNPKSDRANRLRSALLIFLESVERHSGVDLSLSETKQNSHKLLTTDLAAKLLGRKKHTLENWRTIGVGPSFHKVGGRILYKKDELQRFLNERKFGSTSEYCGNSFAEERN